MWSAGIVAGLIVFSTGRAQMAALPWAGSVVGLLALADACQLALARIFTDAYNRFMQKLPLNGGNAMKAEDVFQLPPPELGWREAGLVLRALGSFSVWPFYGALLAVVVAFHFQNPPPGPIATSAAPPNTKSQPAMKPPQSVTTSVQPRQTPFIFPQKTSPQQPGVRFPTVPPTGYPANRFPVQDSAAPLPPRPGAAIPFSPIQGAGAP